MLLSQFKMYRKLGVAFVAAALFIGLVALMPSSAALSDDIDKANEDSGSEPDEATAEFDVANVSINEITDQLKTLNLQVADGDAQKKKLDSERESLTDESSTFEEDIAGIELKIEALAGELSILAVVAFKNQGKDSVLADVDPSDSLRKRQLSSSVAKNEIETAEELRQAKADLAEKEAAKVGLLERLDTEAQENAKNLVKYEEARNSLVEVAELAEERAERTLSEAEGLENLDKARADELRTSVSALSEQIRLALSEKVKKEQAEAEANPEVKPPTVTVVGDSDIREVGNGIQVHKDIADAVAVMLADAEAAGITLAGGGFRSSASQIAVRKNNCGTSYYAIYQMPSSSCTPPTAIPGRSMHEKGLAIDFTDGNGATIRVGSPQHSWLSANAASYGLYNYPVESWHWSTDGT